MYAWKHRLKSLDPPHSIFVEIHSGINCRGHSTQVGLWQFKVYLQCTDVVVVRGESVNIGTQQIIWVKEASAHQ